MVSELIKQHALLLRNEVRLSDIREAHEARRRQIEHFQLTERASMQQEYNSIRTHVSPRSYDEDLNRLQGSICPGTGSWLLRDKKFRDWMDPSQSASQILWLKGIPGSGRATSDSCFVFLTWDTYRKDFSCCHDHTPHRRTQVKWLEIAWNFVCLPQLQGFPDDRAFSHPLFDLPTHRSFQDSSNCALSVQQAKPEE